MISTKQKFETKDMYIKIFPKDIQKLLETIRQTIKKSVPVAEEAISYQIPTFKLKGNLVHFAAFKNHIGFYPGSKAIKDFQKDLTKYKSSKGAVQFPIDNPMPLSLIRKIVKHGVKENSRKSLKKK